MYVCFVTHKIGTHLLVSVERQFGIHGLGGRELGGAKKGSAWNSSQISIPPPCILFASDVCAIDFFHCIDLQNYGQNKHKEFLFTFS
jgi:hypothetical protein